MRKKKKYNNIIAIAEKENKNDAPLLPTQWGLTFF